MQKISKLKLLSAILFTLIAVIYSMPNFTGKKLMGLPGDKVNLGLDLRGGSHLLLNVDFDSYMDDATSSTVESIKKYLRNDKIGYRNFKTERNKIIFEIRSESDLKKTTKLVRNIDSNISLKNDGLKFTVFYNEYALNQLQDKVIDQSIEIVRMRVDSNGTKEPTIQRQGVGNILLQVPGEENPAALKKMLGKTAKLSFHLEDEQGSVEYEKTGHIKMGSKIAHFSDSDKTLIIKKKAVVTGDELNNASVSFQNANAVVHFSFNNIGARKFGEATAKNKGRRLVIILDGKILSAPNINEPILGGDGIISGNFTVESANELALMLRAGALPAPLKVVEERTIGPNLGADSIESGKTAALCGFILVIIFMLLSYGILGIFANITLCVSLLYILALLSMLQATLTLPGIAGVILTIGMAVDANVLIYERIREELEKGCSNLYAVKIGFESAFATITDSNVTTLIAAFLLYSFGVGAIKGFAVTLTIGIISSMYCALVLTKLMIDLWLKYNKPTSLGL